MKNILAIFAFAVATLADAATTVPVQLINPTGSTSGQAIVSTGAGTAPAWGGVNATTLNGATFSAPGPIGSTTAGTGAFTALGATGLISPTYPAGISGNKTGSNVSAGSVGEPSTGTAATVSMTPSSPLNCASATLTPGDWDVGGTVTFTPNTTTIFVSIAAGISTTSATMPAANTGAESILQLAFTTGAAQALPTPQVRVQTASTISVYLVGFSNFSTSTMTCSGFISARRR